MDRRFFIKEVSKLYADFGVDVDKMNLSGIWNVCGAMGVTNQNIVTVCNYLRVKVSGNVTIGKESERKIPGCRDWENAIKDMDEFRWNITQAIKYSSEWF